MSTRLFGTDGIRGRFGDEPLTESWVRRIAAALAGQLLEGSGQAPPRVFVGGDPRASTAPISDWLFQGLDAAGVPAIAIGTLPTPAVAWWTAREQGTCGVAISASHNPAGDNGIKLFDGRGFKWSEDDEIRLEERIAAGADPGPRTVSVAMEPEAGRRYLQWLVQAGGGSQALAGWRIGLDTANGAAAPFAAPLFRALGADVEVLFDRPDGHNINLDCGSTAPHALQQLVVSRRLQLGFAFDGDADRCLLLDETGSLRDGDAMLYLWARELQRRGELHPARVVATSMSNLGLERALGALGVDVERCNVGDREVVSTLRRAGLRLGGEQSGHLVDLHRSTTGDGLLTAVLLAAMQARSHVSVSEALAEFRRFPQVLINVPVARKPALDSLAPVVEAARRVESELGSEGRLVLRYSGTEPLARVMIEGPDEAAIRVLADRLVDAIRGEIGAPS
ncbi:MAG: phosphoglucosamine mutase [Thermoanaerobaculia bacterium]